jgi:hypothetical protein
MLDTLTVSAYLLPPPVIFAEGALTDERRSRADSPDPGSVRTEVRAALKQQSNSFEELYRKAEQTNATPEELEEAVEIILDNEQKLATALEKLKQNLARRHPPTDFARSARRSAEESLGLTQSWLELYQNLRIRLLKLASDRRVAAGEIGSAVVSDADEMERYLRRIAGE